jgi:hypothetical protein
MRLQPVFDAPQVELDGHLQKPIAEMYLQVFERKAVILKAESALERRNHLHYSPTH